MKQLLAAFLIAQTLIAQDCQLSDGICNAEKQQSTETIHPIRHAEFTANAILVDSCTWCGKDPVTNQ